MKQEDIEAIRTAQKRSRELEEEQRAAHKAWENTHLTPLRKACDHTYPWGEEAIVRDFYCNYISCRICGSQLPRYS
jgi:hypothetical protein